MIRSIHALALFFLVLASYGWAWLRATLRPAGAAARWEAVHLANAQRLAANFARLGGIYIKLGQVVSVLGTFLPKAYGDVLEQLQDRVPAKPFSEAESRLREAFGPQPLRRFRSFEEVPVAAASLAQVHRATLKDGRVVAVKILYPGIEAMVATDLATLALVLPLLRIFFGAVKFERVLDQLSAMLNRETDYRNERNNIERVRQILGHRNDVVIPKVVPELSTRAVLTMSFESGFKIGDLKAFDAHNITRQAVARILVECYFSMLLDAHVFHADPHPGNFLVQAGPKLVILDFGAVESIPPELVDGIKTVILGGLTRNPELVFSGIVAMGFVAEGGDMALLKQVGREYLAALSEVKIGNFSSLTKADVEKLSGFRQLRGRMRPVMQSIEYPDGYFYVERTLALLFGLVGQLAPEQGLPGIAAPLAARALLRGSGKAAKAPGSPA